MRNRKLLMNRNIIFTRLGKYNLTKLIKEEQNQITNVQNQIQI